MCMRCEFCVSYFYTYVYSSGAHALSIVLVTLLCKGVRSVQNRKCKQRVLAYGKKKALRVAEGRLVEEKAAGP